MNIEWISKNKNGDYYVGTSVEVQRGIRGNHKGKTKELLIIGVPKADFPKFCKDHNIAVKEL